MPMRQVTLRQLRVFETVARHLNHTRAAEELMLTQPAVSLQVKQLEEHVGIALFEQIGKRLHLTEAGLELHHYIRAITQQLTEAEEVLARLKGLEAGHLRLAVVRTAKYFAPKLLALFKERFGRITLTLDVTGRDELLKGLAANEIDLAIMGRPPEDQDVVGTPFLDNPLVIVAAPTHPLAAARAIPPADLADETWILREPGSGTRSVTEGFLQQHELAPATVMVMSSTEAIKQGVQAGLGVSLVPVHTALLELETRRLVVLDVIGLPISRTWYLVVREGKRLSHAAQAFKDFVLTEGAGQVTVPATLVAGNGAAGRAGIDETAGVPRDVPDRG